MSGPYPRHLGFLFHVGPDGRTVNPTSLADHVKGEVIQLLLTNQGEREFVPAFGGGVRGLLFEPIDDALVGMSKAQITRSISDWLGHRVVLEDLQVESEESEIRVELKYSVPGIEESRVLRFHHPRESP
jgi:phage baseplate assembly protein W